MARPTDYSIELGAEICERLALGESLKRICEADNMPSQSTVYLWIIKNKEFSEMYTRAREDQVDTHVDGMTDLTDSATPENVNVVRLQVETRKWIASKLKPRKYGEKVQQEHSGVVSLDVSWKPTENAPA